MVQREGQDSNVPLHFEGALEHVPCDLRWQVGWSRSKATADDLQTQRMRLGCPPAPAVPEGWGGDGSDRETMSVAGRDVMTEASAKVIENPVRNRKRCGNSTSLIVFYGSVFTSTITHDRLNHTCQNLMASFRQYA